MNSSGAELSQVAPEFRLLWFQCGIYFISACLIYRYQIIRSHQLIRKQYRFMKARMATIAQKKAE